MKIVKIILDVMSPAEQSIIDLIEVLNKIDGVAHVDITLSELEKNVEDFKVTIEGEINYEGIRSAIRDFGGVIRNVDNVISAEEYIPRQDSNKLSAAMLVLARHFDPKTEGIEQVYDEFEGTLKYIRSRNQKIDQ